MSAIETVSEPSNDSAQSRLEAALAGIARATSFYDFENAWITGLRMVTGSNGHEDGNRVLAAAGERLHVLGELKDDVARRGWLRHIAETVKFRGDGWIGGDLERVAAREAREAFARVIGDLTELREFVASGESLNEFAARRPRPADRLRDLGGIAEALRSSGLLTLCPAEDCGLARDLARAMSAPVHLVPTVPEPLRVSRDDLIRWAQTSEAAAQFPRLVRSLVAETEPSAEWIDMPAGTGTASPGWDGAVRCARGNRFVPVGKSAWELTTQQNGINKKAGCDYAKRLKESTADERAEVAYVAAACAPWTKRRTFESDRTGDGDFDRVVALNVDNLEDWLSCAIASTLWMRDQIGKPTEGIGLLAKWWENWLAATTTPLDEGLVLAGREKAAAELREHCNHGRGIVTVGGRVHRDEIIAFTAAALKGGEGGGTSAEHVLYVDNHATAERLFAQEALSIPPGQPSVGLVLTMVVPSVEFAKHLPAGSPHRMVVPLPGSPQAAITLDAVDSDVINQRLQAVGFEPHAAHELGGVARTSLMALRRCLANEPALHTPSWATGHIDTPLRRCLMLGGWNGTRLGDREVVERFTGKPYSEVTDLLSQINPADAPLAAVVEQWHSVSPAATWVLMRASLTSDDIKEFAETAHEVLTASVGDRSSRRIWFAETAHEVLTASDPLLELSAEDAIRARMDGAQAKFSPELRRGLATTLALAGSLPLEAAGGAPPASSMADNVTSWLLRSALDDPTPRTWTALADVLPLLAEADPDTVLHAFRRCLAEHHSFTREMFTDSGASPFAFNPPSPHHRVMNALEVIAWSPEHLLGVVDLLARLTEFDPGGRYSDRPADRLSSILCAWMPYTSASVEERLAAVRMLRRSHPDVAWQLMLSMLPRGHDTQAPGALPSYRDWRSSQPAVTHQEHARVMSAVAAMLIDDVDQHPEHWTDLIRRLADLPGDACEAAVAALGKIANTQPDETYKSRVWPVLRNFVDFHLRHRDAQSAFPTATLQALEQVRDSLSPAEPAVAFSHLFSSGLRFVDGVGAEAGYEEFQAAVRPRQAQAVKVILADGGLNAVLDFAARVELSRRVGGALAQVDPTLDVRVLGVMEAAPEPVTQVALGYFDQRFAAIGWEGMHQLLAEHDVSVQVTADLLRSPPPIAKPWRQVDAFGSEVADEYWHRVTYYDLGRPCELNELLTMCRRLRLAGRTGLSLQLLALSPEDHLPEPNFADEAAAALDTWVEHPSDVAADAQMTHWEITTLLKSLDGHRDRLGVGRLAMLEWRLLPLLRNDPEFNATNLYREMARTPAFFVQLVECAFRPADAPPDEQRPLTEAQQQKALNAFHVLREWPASQFTPGFDDEGKLDADLLDRWIDSVREQLTASRRGDIGDETIGTALAASPPDPGDEWPGVAVRQLLERLQNDDIERGFRIAASNWHSFTVRAPTAGGAQERELAEKYRQQGHSFKEWPRTAAIFDGLVRSYEHRAEVEDREAEALRRGLPG